MKSGEKQSELLFPNREILDSILALKAKGAINASPTQFIGMTSEQIAGFVMEHLEGRMVINVSKASEPEREAIRGVVGMEGVDVTILGENGDIETENEILRAIVEQIIEDGDKVNVARMAFNGYIRFLFDGSCSYSEDLIRDEWNKYIVNHPHTGQINSPYESHHFRNVGLKTRSEGPDELRDKVEGFIKGIMEQVREDIEVLFSTGTMRRHKQNSMNTPDARVFLLGNAFFSNFVRGGTFYRYMRGEESVDEYEPRRIAAQIIDAVHGELAAR